MLLRELRSDLDESWYRFLWTYLASPAVANHRNELAHVLIETYEQSNATLLLVAALHLVVGAHLGEAQDNNEGQEPDGDGKPGTQPS